MLKPQDLIFTAFMALLLIIKRPAFLVWAGLISLVLAMPLFAIWIFFTAERLTWYAAAFFLVYILLTIKNLNNVK